jgi:hypothetical protein
MAKIQEKMLYFNTADNDSVAYPISSFRGIDQSADTTLDLYFSPIKITDVATGDVADKIPVTIAAGKEKDAISDIANALADAYSAALVVIGDDANSVYVSSHITAVGAVTLAA